MPDFQRIKSPEQLNDYVRVTTAGAWLVLLSIVIFFAGFFLWIFNGELEISFPSLIYTESGVSSAYLKADKVSQLRNKANITVRIPNTNISGTVKEVSHESLRYEKVADEIGENNSDLIGISEGDRVFKVSLKFDEELQNITPAVFIVERVKPVSYLLRTN